MDPSEARMTAINLDTKMPRFTRGISCMNENHQLGWWFKRAFWRYVLG